MIDEMNKIDQKFNTNMPVFNYCLERQLNKFKVFTGYPLHNIFKSNRAQEGIYIKHK